MNILYSWKESLSLLKPQNLKLFTLVTIKSLIELYKLLFFKYWWSASLTMFAILIYSNLESSIFYYLVLLLYSRPSIENKNSHYIRHYFKYYLAILIANTLIGILLASIIIVIIILYPEQDPLPILLTPSLLTQSLLTQLSALFILDNSSPFKNILHCIKNGLKMFLFNAPIMIILITISVISYILIPSLQSRFLYALVVGPLYISIVTNVYIKRLYEQYDLYYKKA